VKANEPVVRSFAPVTTISGTDEVQSPLRMTSRRRSVVRLLIVLGGLAFAGCFLHPKPWILYAHGIPKDNELFFHEHPNPGSRTPPLVISFLVLEDGGLSYYRQSAATAGTAVAVESLSPASFRVRDYDSGYEEDIRLRDWSWSGFVSESRARKKRASFTCRQITSPAWPFILVGCAPAAVMVARFAIRMKRRSSRAARGCCPTCGYDLRATTSGRCPECGSPFRRGQTVVRIS
jgi:hypothetical protein